MTIEGIWETPMPDAIGTAISAIVASPVGASELLVGLLVGLFLVAFAVRGTVRQEDDLLEPLHRSPSRR